MPVRQFIGLEKGGGIGMDWSKNEPHIIKYDGQDETELQECIGEWRSKYGEDCVLFLEIKVVGTK